ncbi:MAG TPA: DUF4870 domain-containing protein [Flavobacteriia bacterium]|jgi:uncharacterized Tic20 family protein|nr:DUF4870 domain-containing protein [Flavobacteriia bacterium]
MELEKQLTVTKFKDTQLLVLLHLSQLLDYITGLGGIIVPLIIWLTNKDKIEGIDEQGKEILNFKISMLIYIFISIPLIFLFGLGILSLVIIGLISFIMPIINAVKVSNGEKPSYPFTINFIG